MERLRVVVADDHREMLATLVSVIEDDPRFAVVGMATTGHDAWQMAADSGADLVLLDVKMPGGGTRAAEALAALPDAPSVVAISAESGSRIVADMLSAGAVGYLTKGHLGDMLPELLWRCAHGEVTVIPPEATVGPDLR
jgi:two-component system nitrate/nitrite response regulator NarL